MIDNEIVIMIPINTTLVGIEMVVMEGHDENTLSPGIIVILLVWLL